MAHNFPSEEQIDQMNLSDLEGQFSTLVPFLVSEVVEEVRAGAINTLEAKTRLMRIVARMRMHPQDHDLAEWATINLRRP